MLGQITIELLASAGAFVSMLLTCLGERAGVDFSSWSWPLAINIPLFGVGFLYCLGFVRLSKHRTTPYPIKPLPPFLFAAGWLALVLALDSPIHELGEQLFWVHMTQHEILVLIAAPLLVLSHPLAVLVWAIPRKWRQPIASVAKISFLERTWLAVTAPAVAWTLHALALWIWHAPALFNLTLTSDVAHAAQHVSFFGTALVFWWTLVHGHAGKLNYGASILYVFTTAIHTSVLGALLTFASRPWYSPYALTTAAWHLTPLQDQQIGGLVMWVPAGTVLIAIALWMVPKWLQLSDRRWILSRSAELIHNRRGVVREN
jgi:putative membrane protein